MDPIPTFNQEAMERIKQTVRTVEGWGDKQGPPGGLGGRGIPFGGFWLGKAREYAVAGSVASFFILQPDGNKGTETPATNTPIDVYVRRGLIHLDVFYLLVAVCGADDAVFEVLNPTISVIGKADSAITKSNPGTVSVWSGTTIGSESDTTHNITSYTRFADIASGKWVRAYWNDDSKAWDAEAAEC